MTYSRDELLAQMRQAFPAFYARATAQDAGTLDGLVLAHAGLVVGLNAPRTGVPPEVRAELERATDHAEMIFTELRERVRACETFKNVREEERTGIEQTLFTVRMPPPA